MIRSLVSTSILAVLLVGCGGDGTGPESGTQVTLGFTAGSSAAQTSGAQAAASMSFAGPGELVVPGNNGILTISDVWMIVAEFELEKVSGSCTVEGSECHDFEAPPSFLHLPLDGDFVPVATSDIPVGSYDELEFEVEDLLDDNDDDDAAQIQAVRDQISMAGITNWPDEASMLIVGSFQPTDGLLGNPIGLPRDVRVYFDAEVEIERDLDPILVIPTSGDDPVTLTVDVQPDLWFKLPSGDVLDMSQFNWDPRMELLEFEFELEDGFAEIEIG